HLQALPELSNRGPLHFNQRMLNQLPISTAGDKAISGERFTALVYAIEQATCCLQQFQVMLLRPGARHSAGPQVATPLLQPFRRLYRSSTAHFWPFSSSTCAA